MLYKSKEETLNYTEQIAQALHKYVAGAKKRDRSTLVEKELLAAASKNAFLNSLSQLIEEVEESDLQIIKELRDKVYLLNKEDFTYLKVLLKFDYAYQQRQSQVNN
jgi:hypothetical protein